MRLYGTKYTSYGTANQRNRVRFAYFAAVGTLKYRCRAATRGAGHRIFPEVACKFSSSAYISVFYTHLILSIKNPNHGAVNNRTFYRGDEALRRQGIRLGHIRIDIDAVMFTCV